MRGIGIGARHARLATRRHAVTVGLVVAISAGLLPGAVLSQSVTPDLGLVGTILQDATRPGAIIEDRRAKTQQLYRLGDRVGGGRLTKILDDRVILMFQGAELELRLGSTASSQAPAQPSAAPEFPSLERHALLRLSGAPGLDRQVQPVGDKGVQVRDAPAGGLLETLGVRKGDIIRTINGSVPGASLPVSEAIEPALRTRMLRLHVERADGTHAVYYFQIQP